MRSLIQQRYSIDDRNLALNTELTANRETSASQCTVRDISGESNYRPPIGPSLTHTLSHTAIIRCNSDCKRSENGQLSTMFAGMCLACNSRWEHSAVQKKLASHTHTVSLSSCLSSCVPNSSCATTAELPLPALCARLTEIN